LGRCGSLCATIDLGHQESLPAITVAQGFTHSNFALSSVVIPAVIKKIDSLIDSCTNDPDAFARIALSSQVIPTEPDQ